jgi:hypothetical protein
MERSNLENLNDAEVKEHYQIKYQLKISNRFAALGNLADNGGDETVDINWAKESIRQNINTSATVWIIMN